MSLRIITLGKVRTPALKGKEYCYRPCEIAGRRRTQETCISMEVMVPTEGVEPTHSHVPFLSLCVLASSATSATVANIFRRAVK